MPWHVSRFATLKNMEEVVTITDRNLPAAEAGGSLSAELALMRDAERYRPWSTDSRALMLARSADAV
jgi:hypothetical protein